MPDPIFDLGPGAADPPSAGEQTQVLTALGGGATGRSLFTTATPSAAKTVLGVTRRSRTTNASKTSDTTYAADTEITSIAVSANTNYRGRLVLFATLGAGGLKARLTLPSVVADTVTSAQRFGMRMFWGQSFATPITGDSTANAITFMATNDTATNNQYVGVFEFMVGNSGGNAVFEWAQNSSNGTASTLLAGSYLELEEL